MELRRGFKKEYAGNWVQTAMAIVGLLFVVLASFGLITPEQSAEAQPLIATTLGAVSTAIAGIVALVGLFFKNSE